MQKTLLYLLLLLIIATGAYFFVFKNNTKNIFSDKEAGFNVYDTAMVGKIFLARTNGEEITLVRTDSGWILNNKYKAHTGVLNTFLRTLKLQQAAYPVPEELHNGIIKSMAGTSVKVELYDLKGEKMKTFYVGIEVGRSAGNYMLMEHAKRPYAVVIPNFEGILSPIYSTDITDWRNRNVFDLNPGAIKSVAVQYPSEPLNSFTVKNEDSLEVETAPGVPGSNPLNQRRVKAFLGFFSNLNCEGFMMSMPKMDSIIASVPKLCSIDLVSKNGKEQRVDVYRMPNDQRSKNLLSPRDDGYDIDRYYAVMNNYKDTAVIQSATFNKIFRKAYEFYQADKTIDPIKLEEHLGSKK